MASNPRSRGIRHGEQKKKPDTVGVGDDRLLTELMWNMVSINTHLEDIRRIWAEALGVSGPQWLILMAISELDAGQGASVSEVSAKIHVRSTFVTLQTKQLEQLGFLTRSPSAIDGRIVLMSLTPKAHKEITKLSNARSELNSSIFSDINHRTLKEVSDSLALIRRRVAKAALQLNLDRN